RAAVGWVPWQPAPKNEKNIPTKLFEYMTYGVPIVSSDLASTRPFVQPGANGLLVPASDPGAHATAILELLEHPENGVRMGQRGQELVRTRYNWGEMEGRLLAFYDDVLARVN
ncbi:MAG: glycosyltransferase, partial [Chloroflexota bacterium]